MLKSGGCIYSRIDKNLCYNKTMSKMRRGFTLIEVALFLAVTGLLFAGVMVGVQNSIWQQRYNDTVQNFANFLRNVYSEVSNPQSPGDGRSDRAIYGKLISFGQSYGLGGGEEDKLAAGEQKIFVYDVVGDVDASKVGTGSVTEVLKKLDANVVIGEKESDQYDNWVYATPAGIVESYSPIWSSAIERTKREDDAEDYNLYKGSILIVRHPKSGTINTLVSDGDDDANTIDGDGGVIDVNNTVGTFNSGNGSMESMAAIKSLLTDRLDTFKAKEVNFCINPYGVGESGTVRHNIRIIKNARNASGVEIIDLDRDGEDGNKCVD